jgi:hypothetical protein
MKPLTTMSRPPRAFALSAAAAAALALALGACAGAQPGAEPATPPAAAVRQPARRETQLPRLTPTAPPSDLSPSERFAWQQVVQLGEAFAAGNAEDFLARVSRGFYRGYSALESSLKQLLAESSAHGAVVAVRQVAAEEGRVSVRAEWTSSVTRRDGSVDARYGETVFIFLKSDQSLRLLDYRGDAPFAIGGI